MSQNSEVGIKIMTFIGFYSFMIFARGTGQIQILLVLSVQKKMFKGHIYNWVFTHPEMRQTKHWVIGLTETLWILNEE